MYQMYIYSRLCVFKSEDSLLFFLSTAVIRLFGKHSHLMNHLALFS